MPKVYCSISNHTLAKNVSEDKLNYNTYLKLLDEFDEVHIYGRTFEKESYLKKDRETNIYMHYVSVPKNKLLRYFVTLVKMFLIIKRDNKIYNFLIFDASEPTTGGIIGSLLKILTNKPFLLQIQGEVTRIDASKDGFIKPFVLKKLTLLCSRFATKIRAVSHIIKAQLLEDGVDENKIEVLPPRVKLEQFDYSLYTNANESLRDKFKIPSHKQLLVFVGRLVICKGVKYLIEACNKLDTDKYHLLIVGDGELREELEELTNRLNLESNITFVGRVDFTKVPYYMAGGDFLIVPSLDEGFGRVILESMAVKTMVLASRVGGIQDIIVDYKTGFFMRPKDPIDIANVINRVFKMEQQEIEIIVENSYHIVQKEYEFHSSMDKFLKLYKKCIDENS